jgi:alpha-beta hydrolase superfamily lysophospholipase
MSSTTSTVAARNGTALLLRHWPPTGVPRARLLIVHGLGEHSGRYDRAASIFAAQGLEATGLDLQGFGGSGGRRAFIDRMDTWLDDVEDRLGALRADGAGRPVVLLGHSMGGLVALRYAESDRPQPDLLILSAPAIADALPAWKHLAARVLGRLAPTLSVANGLDGALLSRDPAVGAAYVADPLNHHASTTGLGLRLLDAQAAARAEVARVRVPTLVIHGSADPLVPVASSEILASVPGVERRVLANLRHESLNEPEGPQVAADLAAWIERRLASGPDPV